MKLKLFSLFFSLHILCLSAKTKLPDLVFLNKTNIPVTIKAILKPLAPESPKSGTECQTQLTVLEPKQFYWFDFDSLDLKAETCVFDNIMLSSELGFYTITTNKIEQSRKRHRANKELRSALFITIDQDDEDPEQLAVLVDAVLHGFMGFFSPLPEKPHDIQL